MIRSGQVHGGCFPKAERLKRERRTGLTTFVRELQRQLGQ
jgi:hypothetical protein